MKNIQLTLITLFFCFIINFKCYNFTNIQSVHFLFENFKNNTQKSIKFDKSFSGYFYLQKIRQSGDLIDLISKSEKEMKLFYFTLNEKNLFYRKKLTKSSTTKILGEIDLEKIYSEKEDNFKIGKCCINLDFKDYSICDKEDYPKTKNNKEIYANFCIEINIEKILWRICSNNKILVKKFLNKLRYFIVKLKSQGKQQKKIIENLYENSNNSGMIENKNLQLYNFHWDSQDKWGGKCNRKYIFQSPINVITKESKSDETDISFDYKLNVSRTLVQRRSHEVIVNFQDHAGMINLNFKKEYYAFQADKISFRFPGEHSIDGIRPLGEILIHFNEVNPNRKTWITNGLIVTIPLYPNQKHTNLHFLERLNLDFWKEETSKNKEFIPHIFKKKNKPLDFPVSDIFSMVTELNPNYYIYIGSSTIPPCETNVIQIVIDKPLPISNCQFKLLRESSLLTSRPKEIHSRVTQPLLNRKIVKLQPKNFIYKKNLDGLLSTIKMKFENYLKLMEKSLGKDKKRSIASGKAFKSKFKGFIKDIYIPQNPKVIKNIIKKLKQGIPLTDGEKKQVQEKIDCEVK